METFTMTLDYQEISRLLAEAEKKIERFEKKIQDTSTAMEQLKAKHEAVLAALEYVTREETRRKLTDLFVRDGEYGLPINFSAELLSQIEKRKNDLDQKIHSYEQKLEERQKGIEFIRHDIELLKKIQHLELQATFDEEAVLIDG